MIQKYNDTASGLYSKAQDYLVGVSPDEVEEWYSHNITKSILCTLEADLLCLMINTSTGVYSGESVDVTVQAMAKAIGQTQTCSQILDHIRSIVDQVKTQTEI